MVTIVFEDRGQGFREWDIDPSGKVVAVRPYSESAWVGFMVVNEFVSLGDRLTIDLNNAAWRHLGLPDFATIAAPVAEVRKGGSTWVD